MVIRNASLLLILAPMALVGSLAAFLLMLGTSLALVLWSYCRRSPHLTEAVPTMKMGLPFSLPLALKYGVVFLLLHIVGGLTQRSFDNLGFYFVSVVGGLMSSASAVAAAATLAAQGNLAPTVAGNGAVLASFTSIAFSLSFVLRSGNRELIRRLAATMICVALAGTLGLAISDTAYPVMKEWLPQIGQDSRAVSLVGTTKLADNSHSS